MVLYPGTSMYVRGEVGMDYGNTQDAVPDARAKAARQLSQIRLRLGDDLHRRRDDVIAIVLQPLVGGSERR